jgi:acetoacetyl-CoA synthetase
MQSDRPLWTPSREFIDQTPMKEFIDWCEQRFSKSFADYDAFHDWSISKRADFWTAVWDHCGVIGEKGARALIHGDRMLDAARTRRNRACPLINCGYWSRGCSRL